MWFFYSEEDYKNKEERENKDVFKLFVKEEVKYFFFDDDFFMLVFGFFYRVRNGVELFLEIFNIRVMEFLREE